MSETQSALPPGFEAFEPYLDWALATQSERREKHFANSSFEEVQALHSFGHEITQSGLTRIEDALAYLDQLPISDLPEDAKRLMQILLSIAEVTVSVEAWGEINPTHSIGDFRRFVPLSDTEAM